MIVYKATNKVDGKSYIGQTITSLRERKSQHKCDAFKRNRNYYFQNAIRKYGINGFKWMTLHICTNTQQLNETEIYYIKLYDTFNNGYNLTIGGKGSNGKKASKETRLKMSIAGKKRKRPKRKPFSKEWRQKMSDSKKGEKNHQYGKPLSEKTKKKLSLANLCGKHPQAKSVMIKGKHFPCLREAAEYIGLTTEGLRHRVINKTKWIDYYYV